MNSSQGREVLPLSLVRLTRREALARSALAQRMQAVPLRWDGREWRLTLVPLVQSPVAVSSSDRCFLRLDWGGAPFEIALPATAVQAWVAERFPGLDLPALPPPFAALALEAATARLLEAVQALDRGEARLESLEHAGGAGLAHAFEFELAGQAATLRGVLATNDLGLMLMTGATSRLPAVANGLGLEQLPASLLAQLGFTWLDPREIATLRVGDSVLLEHTLLEADGELWIGRDDWGLRVRAEGHGLTVSTPFTRGGWNMSATPVHDGPDDGAITLAQLPMRLAFDLGEIRMTLGELQGLQPGQPLDLGRPLAGAVSLRVNGACIGSGELVEIDGRLGVTIQALNLQAASAVAHHRAEIDGDPDIRVRPAPPASDELLDDALPHAPGNGHSQHEQMVAGT